MSVCPKESDIPGQIRRQRRPFHVPSNSPSDDPPASIRSRIGFVSPFCWNTVLCAVYQLYGMYGPSVYQQQLGKKSSRRALHLCPAAGFHVQFSSNLVRSPQIRRKDGCLNMVCRVVLGKCRNRFVDAFSIVSMLWNFERHCLLPATDRQH